MQVVEPSEWWRTSFISLLQKTTHLCRFVLMTLLVRRLRTPVLLALVMVATVSACKKGDGDDADSTSGAPAASEASSTRSDSLSLPVVAEEARNGDLVLRVNTTGIVRSRSLVKLTAEVAGVIVQLPVRSGSVVKKGAVILKVDPYPLEMAVRDAQSKLDQAEQRVF
ncbi:MAG: biotin/lipoyl-binding protein [Phycisphaerae bacterium]|nr:biotin/lipoyl-binding protein [Gemmatimonadaceae bacterium]